MVPHGPRQENGAGCFDLCGHIPGDGNGDGRYAPGFNRTLDQSDGLMTDRSSGDQQGDVGSLLDRHGLGNIMGNGALEFFRIHVVADETEEILR